MAFVSMIFAFLAIVLIILGILFIAGLILLIIGVVNKRKPKNKGKKYPIVLIVIGSLLLIMPVGTGIVLIACSAVGSVSTSIKRMDYESVTDKWRNEWTTDHAAANEAINELLTCADSGDYEHFAKTFTPNIQKSEDFEKNLDDFFSAYPAGLSQCELDGGNVGSSGSYNYGHNVQTGSTSYTCVMNDEWYHIRLQFCYENTDSPDDVGVTFFSVENLEATALDIEYDKSLVCNIKSKSEVSARLIKNIAFEFEPHPDRMITKEEMRTYLRKYDDLSSLEEEIGSPNVTKKYDICTGYDHYYELAPENGEPRYAYICTDSPSGSILYGHLCSNTETFYDYDLCPDR